MIIISVVRVCLRVLFVRRFVIGFSVGSYDTDRIYLSAVVGSISRGGKRPNTVPEQRCSKEIYGFGDCSQLTGQ